jgi:hypothetical protein
MTDAPRNCRALLIARALEGQAEEIAINIDLSDLMLADAIDGTSVGIYGVKPPKGVVTLIAALNKGGYQASDKELSFQDLEDLIDFRRAPGASMSKFTNDFEARARACRMLKIDIPENALAFLMYRSGIPQEDRSSQGFVSAQAPLNQSMSRNKPTGLGLGLGLSSTCLVSVVSDARA